eukprot:CAMPEP_0176444014 /NCGR_PEP_ID=MMETSP0127-20121128/22798_1 /TAXON_ID=938130 /ORGANISM="Platyophrya macrostoma, Strain WH" /LENGTH=112 /DNA_ID=CAMNT_0017829417 /DNA_START=61 /DNA_END=399 /DNA_ORIENTATION=-
MSASLVGTSERGATLYTAVTRMSAMVSSAEVGSTTSVPRTIAAVTATGFSYCLAAFSVGQQSTGKCHATQCRYNRIPAQTSYATIRTQNCQLHAEQPTRLTSDDTERLKIKK